MDLSILDTRKKSNEGAFLHLRSPSTGEKLYDNKDLDKPVGFYVLGKDSDVFFTKSHEKQNSRITDKATKVTSESIEQDSLELLAALTTGWSNITIPGHTEFSEAAALAAYSLYPWAKEQADSFIGNRANFI